ncbi:signal transduction histidine kinase [Filimonas zeae]|uniref:histidine kinase n=1 Tax=Filimonas zeae TaxID=1737353 RepID=A0A917MTG8_9BACT|nr:HAMP domain-containing sensor histidine kinase [Filimonas zeae]MDR6337650.1 signal transduction histidine kinase [Filimonas zeae]GGH59633.1 hypothetical protein GCM10011379_06620 [Filimonas zeae]
MYYSATTNGSAKEIEAMKLFLAIIAHEVKNTCGAIPALCDFVSKGKSPELHLHAAKVAATNTVTLVDNLLSSIKLMDGSILIEPEMEFVEFGKWITPIVNRSTIYDLNTERKLILNIPDYLQFCPIYTDKNLTEQLLRNLIVNAIKYSFYGTAIEIWCDCIGHTLIINVNNYGTPIPADKVTTIFQPFTQLQKGSAGSGLGLFISKLFTEALGGTITASSSSTTNLTSFTVTIPDCISIGKEAQIRA